MLSNHAVFQCMTHPDFKAEYDPTDPFQTTNALQQVLHHVVGNELAIQKVISDTDAALLVAVANLTAGRRPEHVEERVAMPNRCFVMCIPPDMVREA